MVIRLSESPYDAVTLRVRNALQINVLAETTRKAPRLTNPLRHAVGQRLAMRSNCGRARELFSGPARRKKNKRPPHLIKAPALIVPRTSAQIPKLASNPPNMTKKLIRAEPNRILWTI